MQVDWLVVGAGYTGSVLAERLASQLNQKVLIVERRNHIAGNAYDYHDEHGVLIHKYGPHIFHANDKRIWEYLCQFTQWRPYYHKVLALVEGHPVPVPFNFNSISQLFPAGYAQELESMLLEHFPYGEKVPILKMRDIGEGPLQTLADYVYKHVFHGYTTKQWDLKPEQLSPSVTARIPVYLSRDNRYFRDTYQGIPREGYTRMFECMLDHPNIHILLKTDLRDVQDTIQYKKMIYTGAVDEYFDNRHGELPYRSLRFELRHHAVEQFQQVAQVNYPNEYEYTRITEYKHLTGQQCNGTTIAYEYPQAHVRGVNDPYYPIPTPDNAAHYKKYAAEVDKLENIHFAGRLADYKYYNIDQAVGRALSLFDKICKEQST